MTEGEALFKKKMSTARKSVEWGFGKVLGLFAFVDYKKYQKLYLQPVGKMYRVAVLITNCHTCMSGSQISDFF